MTKTLYRTRLPDGSVFDEEYFEAGRKTGKSFYENYRWLPRRSFKEALAIADALGLNGSSKILDVGCAKGFLVRAFRELEIPAEGCDVSYYALRFAPEGCWNCADPREWEGRSYSHAFAKDVLEHGTREQILATLEYVRSVAEIFVVVVPLGDKGRYRIPEYHLDKTHVTAEDERWWRKIFEEAGWKIYREAERIEGIKDNWRHWLNGNRVFFLER